MLFKITEDPLDPRELERALDKPENGAVVTFQGVVRDNSRGRTVSYLEYDAYEPMAKKVMVQIAEEIKAKWPVTDVAIWHRIGRLEIGEASLLVVVTSGHRREGFEACLATVDRIKEILPIWKKEVWEDGESWVEGDLLVMDREAVLAPEAGVTPTAPEVKRKRVPKTNRLPAEPPIKPFTPKVLTPQQEEAWLSSFGSWRGVDIKAFKKALRDSKRLARPAPRLQ